MQTPERWQRGHSRLFRFGPRRLDANTGRIELEYELDGIPLLETFRLPAWQVPPMCAPALEAALDLLHWVAGISYWKAGCPAVIEFTHRRPDRWQALWLERLYDEGLAEFAWHNGLGRDRSARFPASRYSSVSPTECQLPRRTLVPMGGGKDSLVALERLRRLGEQPVTVQVGQAALIGKVARAAGSQHLVVERHIDPKLAVLNARDAYNGHVPITAINAAALIVQALMAGFDRIAFANERSASEATVVDSDGREVNHQFSKSAAFENMLHDWVRRCITPNLLVFSLLRRDRELAVCREFAALRQYHGVFSSCNRNFHLDGARTQRWCGRCPKCLFVFLALAPFMSPQALAGIFGANLLDDESLLPGFEELLALDGAKPFECVGEASEARAALTALAASKDWRATAVVAGLAGLLNGLDVPGIEQLCRPGGAHRIPHELLAKH